MTDEDAKYNYKKFEGLKKPKIRPPNKPSENTKEKRQQLEIISKKINASYKELLVICSNAIGREVRGTGEMTGNEIDHCMTHVRELRKKGYWKGQKQ
jgi:hypothetical protein